MSYLRRKESGLCLRKERRRSGLRCSNRAWRRAVVVSWSRSKNAKFLEENGVAQMAFKGRIQVGADADITIFDPKTVRDNSTIKQGGLPATGIPYVIVNGTIVVEDSRVLKGVYPGKPIRLPVLE